VAFVIEQFELSERHACRLLKVDRGSYRYESAEEKGLPLKEQLLELARQKRRYGYRRLWALLVKRDHQINIKRVYRWYCEEKLALRRLKRKKLSRPAMKDNLISQPNQEWAMDFVFDRLETGRNMKLLTLVDGYTRECPAIEVGAGLGAAQVTRALERVISERGAPAALRCDNGPEFTSRHLIGWCAERGIELRHIQPGKPMQNAYVESFNGRLRDECLNASWFLNMADARRKIEIWRNDYNAERPHSALAYRTPVEFSRICAGLSHVSVTPPVSPPASI
jgi:putative transposase